MSEQTPQTKIKTRPIRPRGARWMVQLAGACALAFAVIFVSMPDAEACDACNRAFEAEIRGERSTSPAGQDMLRAMELQGQIPVLNSNSALAQADTAAAQPAAGAQPAAAQAQVAAAPTVGSAATGLNPIFEGADFIDIIERDEGLSIPATSFVPQDTEPDVSVTVTLDEGMTYLGQGVMYDGFLANGGIPGKTIRVTEGDIVEMIIENPGTVPHGASIHSAYTQTSKYVGNIGPGEAKSVVFRANTPGVYMYHCAPGGHAIPMHVLFGQYGMMVVEPKEKKYKLEEELGHGPDVEIFLLQHEIYASGHAAVDGNPEYTAFNGRVFRYVEEPIVAHPGDYIRINYLNVGPNLVSTFHLVGIIWDYAYWQGHPENVLHGGQTVTAGPSDSFVIEFRAPPDEGAYLMLNHAVGPTSRGAIGILAVDASAERTPEILADGPAYTEEELEAMAAEAVRTITPFGPSSEDFEHPTVYGADVDEVVVTIKGNSYYPPVIEIEPGTTVTFRNEDVFTYMDGEFSGIHNAIGVSGPESFATDLLGHWESDSVVFTEPGEYDYICTPHPYMTGRIVVRDSADDSTAEDTAEASGCSTTSSAPVVPAAIALAMMLGFAIFRRKVAVR